MSMLGNAGGVRVVHSHPMCTGVMAEAVASAVANDGGRRYHQFFPGLENRPICEP